MYYTDGFIDVDTYDSWDHIFHFTMKINGEDCLFVCICEGKIGKQRQNVEQMLKRWLEQEISWILKRGEYALQKEILRMGEWMGMDVISPVLLLNIGGEVYTNVPSKEVFGEYNGVRGVVGKPAYIMKDVWKGNENGEDIEVLANELEKNMLIAHSDGKIANGFFVMWEKKHDI